MIRGSAIILKEFVQATHRRRTYVLRTVLPGVAFLLIAPNVLMVLVTEGAHWRSIAAVTRPVFRWCSWIQLLAFPVLAVIYARGAIRGEWTRRTMEILCATPLSRLSIVYGKFACALGKVGLVGLSLLPILGIWLYLGHIPTRVALGTTAITTAGTLLFAALAYLQAAGIRPHKRSITFGVDLLVVYLLVPVLLGVTVFPGHPVCVAAVPHWAFYYAITGSTPAGISFPAFLRLAVGLPAGVALLAVGVTPLVFSRAFALHLGTGDRRGWRTWLGARSPRRPALRPNDDPFLWQERGPATIMLRWNLWAVYALVAVIVAIAFGIGLDLRPILEPWALLVLALIGAVVMWLTAAAHGTRVFSREREQGTAASLVLTGVRPADLYKAKLRSILWEFRYQYAFVLALILASAILARDATILAAPSVLVFLIFWPAAGALVGLAFGAASQSSGQAVGGVCMGLVWNLVIAICQPFGFIGALVGFILMTVLVKRWTAWRMSFLLGFTLGVLYGLVWVMLMVGTFVGAFFAAVGNDTWIWWGILLALAVVLSIPSIAYWLCFGARAFEGSILGASTTKQG